jgi:hypothetical protein
MLHVFDDCAHERYQRIATVTEEDHIEHVVGTKRKVASNQKAGSLLDLIKIIFLKNFNRRSNYRIR